MATKYTFIQHDGVVEQIKLACDDSQQVILADGNKKNPADIVTGILLRMPWPVGSMLVDEIKTETV